MAANGFTIVGFCIHVLTASGAACALLALMAAVEAKWAAMFAWLGVALVVDAVDGPLARRLEVAQRLPRWSGETLDLIVDFATYVFVPAYAIAASRLLPEGLETASGILVVVTGALYFADRRMKMPDNYFRGFPALWPRSICCWCGRSPMRRLASWRRWPRSLSCRSRSSTRCECGGSARSTWRWWSYGGRWPRSLSRAT
jgi:phosphatidylserine synthase